MKTGEELIKIANRFYECRRAVKNIYGAEWKKHLEIYKEIIGRKMKADAIDVLKATIELLEHPNFPEGHTLKMMAAAVDMIEPE